jgi:predicted acyl esterase
MKKNSNSKLAFFSLRVLPGLVAAAFISLVLALSNSVGDTSSCPSPQTAQWLGAPTPSPSPAPMLWTDFYFQPQLNAPKPVLVFRGCNAASGDGDFCPFWTDGGVYHLLVQDIRGDCLGGPFKGDMLYKYDQDDGHTFLAGINSQLWGSSGHIAMEGWSHNGIVSYLAAVGAGPYLKGIQPHFATGDLLNYGLFNGGVQHKEIPYPVDLPQTPNQISWKDYVGLGIWDKYLITDNDASRANVAGLHVGGWFDVFGQGILDTSSRLQKAIGPSFGRQKVVIGPWGHGEATIGDGYLTFPSSGAGNAGVQQGGLYDAAWKKGVFQGIWTDWNALPPVKVYLMNAPAGGEWKTYTTWPPPSAEVTFYFTSGHGLSGLHQPSGQLPFTSNPSSPCPTLGGTNNLTSCTYPSPAPSPLPSPIPCGSWDQRPIEGRSDVVVFTSATVAGTIVGRIHADVWVKTDLPDVDVFVRMTDVFPDGHSMLMAQGIQRARYRNGACPQLLVPNQATLVPVDLGSTAWVVNSGHKLRVIVSASAGPNEAGVPAFPARGGYSVNPQNGQEYIGLPNANRTGSINVLVGGDRVGGFHESALFVPQPIPNSTPPDRRPPKPTPCPN